MSLDWQLEGSIRDTVHFNSSRRGIRKQNHHYHQSQRSSSIIRYLIHLMLIFYHNYNVNFLRRKSTESLEHRLRKLFSQVKPAATFLLSFLAMFNLDMKEKEINQIPIPDIFADIFYSLLRYMYTERVNQTERNAAPLLAAADKYLLRSNK